MNDIKYRLIQELEQLEHNYKKEIGQFLTEEDVHVIFRILQNNDQELNPMLCIMEIMIVNTLKNNYLLAEKYVREVLMYYQILPNDDFIKCRHKLFFAENGKNKQLVKKSFFGSSLLEKIKSELEINGIFKKI